MAKYVVLYFPDDSQADTLVEDTLSAPATNKYILTPSQENNVLAEVVGVFKAPTMFCTCSGTKGRIQAWAKGKKYGWWVCKQCGKPAEATAGPIHQMRMVVGQARNLLYEFIQVEQGHDEDEMETIWDRGWGVFGRSLKFKEEVLADGEGSELVHDTA